MRVLRRLAALIGWVLDRMARALVSWAGVARPGGAPESGDDGPPEHWLRYIRARAPWLLAGNRLRRRSAGTRPPARPALEGAAPASAEPRTAEPGAPLPSPVAVPRPPRAAGFRSAGLAVHRVVRPLRELPPATPSPPPPRRAAWSPAAG